jgi:hypothetical protein
MRVTPVYGRGVMGIAVLAADLRGELSPDLQKQMDRCPLLGVKRTWRFQSVMTQRACFRNLISAPTFIKRCAALRRFIAGEGTLENP